MRFLLNLVSSNFNLFSTNVGLYKFELCNLKKNTHEKFQVINYTRFTSCITWKTKIKKCPIQPNLCERGISEPKRYCIKYWKLFLLLCSPTVLYLSWFGVCKEKTIQLRLAINPKDSLRKNTCIINESLYGNHRSIPSGIKLSKRLNVLTTGR